MKHTKSDIRDIQILTISLPKQSLGAAPRWCSHLDALIEELEEEEAPTQYDDYKFVTEDELKQLGLHDLIGKYDNNFRTSFLFWIYC